MGASDLARKPPLGLNSHASEATMECQGDMKTVLVTEKEMIESRSRKNTSGINL